MQFTFIFLFFFSWGLQAAGPTSVLYQKKELGSDSLFNPVSLYFNNAFDTIQNPYLFNQDNYFEKQKIVLRRVRSPIRGIKEGGGTKKFFKDEFLGKRAAPNYTIHLIGGGFDFRKLAEWYQVNGYPAPYVLAFVTSYAAKLGNEAIELSDTENIGAHDHIADLFFFDLVGSLLFTNDFVATLFRDKFQMLSWGGQPLYNLQDRHMVNTASQYIVRPKLMDSQFAPFVLFGMQVLAGASYQLPDSRALSLASGVAMTDPLKRRARLATGLFYEQGGSLMTSLLINSTEQFRYRLNIYPGIILYKKVTTGAFLALDRENNFLVGLNFTLPVGLVKSF